MDQSKSFDLKVFAPFLPSAVSDLVKILGESETLESKRRAARTLTIVIEQSGSRVCVSAFATHPALLMLELIDCAIDWGYC